MIVGAVVGGGAIVGIAVTPGDYSDHSDYSNYDNYSNYSDAAERRRRRIAAKESEIKQQESTVNQYKINPVNGYLKSRTLIDELGTEVSVESVERDGNQKIDIEEATEINQRVRTAKEELEEIEVAIRAIDCILEEEH